MYIPVSARECLPAPVYAGQMGGTPGDGDSVDYRVATPVWRQVAGILRRRIRSGELQPGFTIPSELTLEQELGVARGTIRKGIRLLRSEGLVVTVQGRGTYVASPLPPEDAGTA